MTAASAISAAKVLAQEGRYSEALDVLCETNRAKPDATVECLLARLRHEAVESAPEQLEPPPAPRIAASTDAPGLLQPIAPADLNLSNLRSGLARHGCVFVRGLVGPDDVARLVRGIDRTLDAFDAHLAGADVEATQPWYVPLRTNKGMSEGMRQKWMHVAGSAWTADSPRMLFELLELYDTIGIRALIEEFLGERAALSARKCTLRRLPVDTNGAWHQDGAFLGIDSRTINVWLSLSHCGRDAPGLDLYPRRLDSLAETGTDGAIFKWAVAPDVVDRLPGGVDVVRPEFEPGDALLFDHMFLHRTAVGPEMTRERYAIESWFFAPSTYPPGQLLLLY
jgi:hypothetical protein